MPMHFALLSALMSRTLISWTLNIQTRSAGDNHCYTGSPKSGKKQKVIDYRGKLTRGNHWLSMFLIFISLDTSIILRVSSGFLVLNTVTPKFVAVICMPNGICRHSSQARRISVGTWFGLGELCHKPGRACPFSEPSSAREFPAMLNFCFIFR